MARTLAGGRRDAKLGITPSGKSIWLEKHPSEYKGWSASDHLYAAIIHGANRTRGGEIAEAHRALAGKSRAISPADVAEAHRTGTSLAGRRSHATTRTETAPAKWYFWIRKKGMYGQSWKKHPSWFYHSSFADKAALDRAIREHKKDKWSVKVTLDRGGKIAVKP